MSQKYSVNRLLAMERSLKARLTQLLELEGKSATSSYLFEEKTRKDPVYSVKLVDRKISQINRALFEISTRIKESNATTLVEVDLNYDDLISEIE